MRHPAPFLAERPPLAIAERPFSNGHQAKEAIASSGTTMGRLPPGSVDNAHLIAVPARDDWSRARLPRETALERAALRIRSKPTGPRTGVRRHLIRGQDVASDKRSGPLRRTIRVRPPGRDSPLLPGEGFDGLVAHRPSALAQASASTARKQLPGLQTRLTLVPMRAPHRRTSVRQPMDSGPSGPAASL